MSTLNMSKEFKVGLVVLVAGIILYFGFQFLKGKDFMSTTNTYYAKYDNVQGLQISNPVLYKGYAVGRVENISYDQEKSDSLTVTFEINDDIIIPEGSKALIGSTLLGEIFVNLELSKGSKTLEEDSYLLGGKAGGLTDKVADQISPMLDELKVLFNKINTVLGEEKMDSLGKALEKLPSLVDGFESTAANLGDATGEIKTIMGRVKTAINSVNNIMTSLEPTLANFHEISDSIKEANIAKAITSLNNSMEQLNSVMNKINSEEGTIGQLMNNKELYENLTSAIDNIDFLAADFQANPHRYIHVNVIGKKPEEVTMINRLKPGKLKNGATKLEMELRVDTPSDLKVTFYDMIEKTITPLTFSRKPGTTNKIEFDIPSGVKPGDHAVRVSWNNDKDTDYASVEVK